jgi:flagellar biosynthesis/type III secretory pathway protein FliH
MMANREEQMAHQGWEAGYAEGYAAGLEEAWARVSALIARGPLTRDRFERRNGLLLACRVIARPKTRGLFKRI